MNVQFLLRNKIIQRTISLKRIKKLHILGIESSCDDAAISIVHFEGRKVLTDRRSSDYAVLARAGGVLPYASARHHQLAIPRLISECFAESGIRASDIDAVAVSNRPGIVVSLRVGINYALSFARSIRRPLILVHHMRAHALTMRLFDSNLSFPFAVLLISGAHCLFCLAESPFHFRILVKSEEGSSPGECLDKLARQMDIPPKNGHYGAALEEMAKSCSPQSYQNYKIPLRRKIIENNDWNFDSLKQRYLARIKLDKKKMDKAQHSEEEKRNEIANLCAAIQESVIEYVCLHLEPALAFCAQNVPEFIANPATRNLVVSGGVAANAQFLKTIRSVSAKYQFNVAVPPPNLCSDNGVMVAWTGAEMFNWIKSGKEIPAENGNGEEAHIYWPNELPDSLPAFPRAQIGPEMQWRKTEKKEEIFRVQNTL